MLVLARHVSEGVVIHDKAGRILARVMVVKVLNGDKVRLGVQANSDIGVDRDEIYEAKMNSPDLTEPGSSE